MARIGGWRGMSLLLFQIVVNLTKLENRGSDRSAGRLHPAFWPLSLKPRAAESIDGTALSPDHHRDSSWEQSSGNQRPLGQVSFGTQKLNS